MRQNFKGNKRRKEELRKQRQEEKRNKRRNKGAQVPLAGSTGVAVPEGIPWTASAQGA